MPKRIATQLRDEIQNAIGDAEHDGADFVAIIVPDAHRWLKWAKAIDARMRLDGSKLSKKRKPSARNAL